MTRPEMHESSKKKILLVEDEAIIAMGYAQAVRDLGYEAITAYSGEKAVSTFGDVEGISLILMDIDLGKGMDGMETAHRILEKRFVPIILVTSHREEEYVEAARGFTRYGCLDKSSGVRVLMESIKAAIGI
jgi:CheY-like chemotaxis protein